MAGADSGKPFAAMAGMCEDRAEGGDVVTMTGNVGTGDRNQASILTNAIIVAGGETSPEEQHPLSLG